MIIHLDFETPRISTNTTITRGEQLILHCHVASNRPVKYTWQKDGVPLTSNEANSSSLQIDSVTIKDEGYYTCQANMFERAEKRASYVLRVQCKFDNSKIAFYLYLAINLWYLGCCHCPCIRGWQCRFCFEPLTPGLSVQETEVG